jgi:hypothetical protein
MADYSDIMSSRPTPDDPGLEAAWAHSQMRWCMMTGDWSNYAQDRMFDFFADEVQTFLPPPEISGNPALAITLQMSTLYDEAPVVTAYGPTGQPIESDLLEPIASPVSWALMQDVLESTVGLNDCFVLSCYEPGAGMLRKVARPHEVIIEADPARPDQPVMVKHLELSQRPSQPGEEPIVEWTWTTWDKRDPSAFKVEALISSDGPEQYEDVTRLYWPETTDARPFPFMDGDGPEGIIWPWTAYHRRLDGHVLHTWRGREVWEGTLTYAMLKTFWLAAFRDGAHPQRYGLNVKVTEAGQDALSTTGARVVRMNQMGVLMFDSKGDTGAQLGQFDPAMDPKSAGESIGAFATELAVYAGVAPQDVSIGGGSTGMSGYAIAISREGQRKARQKLQVPMGHGDQLRLATEARMLNAYTTGTPLPTDPADYQIRYAEAERSLPEVKMDLERAQALREAGVLNRVDLFMEFNPGVTREQAKQRLLKQDAEERELEAAMETAEGPSDPAGSSTTSDDSTDTPSTGEE